MMLSVQDLQEEALQDLERMIDELKAKADEVIAQRIKAPEFTDESEGIGAIAEEAAMAVSNFLMGPGAWVPSSVSELLNKARDQFLRAHFQMSDHHAVKAQDLLEEGLQRFDNALRR